MNRRDMIRQLVAATATVLGGSVAARAQPASAAAAPVLGLNSHMLRPEDRAAFRALGVRYARVPGILQQWESDSHYRLVLEDMNRAAQQDGIRLLWMLHNVVSGDAATLDSRAAWTARMSRFAEWIARLSATEAIQPWNEPNGHPQMPFGFHEGTPPAQAGRLYGQALARHAERIRRAKPSCRIVAAGLTLTPGWQDWLQGVVDTAPPVDAYAIHPYGTWSVARPRIEAARRIVGDRAPLWATEFGSGQANGAPFDPEHHLASWRTWIEGNEREGLVARGYGYCLQTDPRYPQHGLRNPDGTPRAAYRWLRDRS